MPVGGKQDKNASFGVFMSRNARKACSREDAQRMFFSASTSRIYQGTQLTDEETALNEGFGGVHNIGKRDTPYFRFQLKHAPLLDRNSTMAARQYKAKPLTDFLPTRELGDLFKRPPAKQPKTKQEAASHYTESFQKRSLKELRGAKAKPAPAQPDDSSRVLGGKGEMMVKRSLYADEIGIDPEGMVCKRKPFELGAASLSLASGGCPGNPWMSVTSKDASSTWGGSTSKRSLLRNRNRPDERDWENPWLKGRGNPAATWGSSPKDSSLPRGTEDQRRSASSPML
jgi:hypothetical protein